MLAHFDILSRHVEENQETFIPPENGIVFTFGRQVKSSAADSTRQKRGQDQEPENVRGGSFSHLGFGGHALCPFRSKLSTEVRLRLRILHPLSCHARILVHVRVVDSWQLYVKE